MSEWKECRLWRIYRANGNDSSLEICHCLDRPICSHHHNRSQIAVGISHNKSVGLQSLGFGETTSTHPGQRRIPCHVNVSVDERFDLALIVRVQHVVHPESLTCKIGFEPFPDRHDFGTVGDCSEHTYSSLA